MKENIQIFKNFKKLRKFKETLKLVKFYSNLQIIKTSVNFKNLYKFLKILILNYIKISKIIKIFQKPIQFQNFKAQKTHIITSNRCRRLHYLKFGHFFYQFFLLQIEISIV